MNKLDNRKIRWYKVSEETGFYVVSAKSHSRARIQWGWNISGNYTASEALIYLRAELCRDKLPFEPKEEGEFFDDNEYLESLGYKILDN